MCVMMERVNVRLDYLEATTGVACLLDSNCFCRTHFVQSNFSGGQLGRNAVSLRIKRTSINSVIFVISVGSL